jgi:hypothetical protein
MVIGYAARQKKLASRSEVSSDDSEDIACVEDEHNGEENCFNHAMKQLVT